MPGRMPVTNNEALGRTVAKNAPSRCSFTSDSGGPTALISWACPLVIRQSEIDPALPVDTVPAATKRWKVSGFPFVSIPT